MVSRILFLKAIFLCSLVMFGLLSGDGNCANEKISTNAGARWQWIKAGNNVEHGWDVSKGDAQVTVKGQNFSASLFWKGSGKDIQISLKGSVVDGKILVKETIYDSDVIGSTFMGKLSSERWKEPLDGKIGIEAITLSDGFSIIGLTRVIKK